MKNSYYEFTRENNKELVIRNKFKNEFPKHFHINIEILIAKSEHYNVVCNGKNYNVSPGSIVFFDSYDIHGYCGKTKEATDDILLIVPFLYMERFLSFRNKNYIENPVIHNEELVENVLSIVKFLTTNPTENVKIACMDLIFAMIEEHLVYSKNTLRNDYKLIKKILQYIERNFKKNITLDTLSQELGYTKEHISRTFNKCLSQSIPNYINQLRLQYIEQIKSDKTLFELIFDAGFNSVPTYYRVKKQYHKKFGVNE